MTQGNIVNNMEKIIEFSSKTVVLSVNDIDTDQIIPARFLTVTTDLAMAYSQIGDLMKTGIKLNNFH